MLDITRANRSIFDPAGIEGATAERVGSVARGCCANTDGQSGGDAAAGLVQYAGAKISDPEFIGRDGAAAEIIGAAGAGVEAQGEGGSDVIPPGLVISRVSGIGDVFLEAGAHGGAGGLTEGDGRETAAIEVQGGKT